MRLLSETMRVDITDSLAELSSVCNLVTSATSSSTVTLRQVKIPCNIIRKYDVLTW